MKIYKNCVVFAAREIEEIGKSLESMIIAPRTETVVVSSDQNPDFSGFKCTHGVYIPATTLSHNRAPYCSLCYPYIVKRKQASNGKTKS